MKMLIYWERAKFSGQLGYRTLGDRKGMNYLIKPELLITSGYVIKNGSWVGATTDAMHALALMGCTLPLVDMRMKSTSAQQQRMNS